MNELILIAVLAGSAWLIRRDTRSRPGLSAALWIPTLWVGVLASRPISLWLGLGGSETIEGSPVDRVFFFASILASVLVLSRRANSWRPLMAANVPLLLFYGFLLLSVLWANSPLVSLKRWVKEAGNILVVLVILSEADPLHAVRAVFVRCTYVLVPMSIVLLRYFPELGRAYNAHSGELQVTGVTTQKNSLGAMIVVCGLMFLWDWLERSRPGSAPRSRIERIAALMIFGAALWLLWACDSKTSTLCLGVAAAILFASRTRLLERRIGALGGACLALVLAFFALDWLFGISAAVVKELGRDMTFTGRTDVWRELLALNTDPLFGIGFMSLWDDPFYRAKLPEWVAFSAHNGYLEIYLAGGMLGVTFLGLLLISTAARLNRALATAQPYSVLRAALFVAALIANFSESNFACMTPIGFVFLIAVIGDAQVQTAAYGHRVPLAPVDYRPSPTLLA